MNKPRRVLCTIKPTTVSHDMWGISTSATGFAIFVAGRELKNKAGRGRRWASLGSAVKAAQTMGLKTVLSNRQAQTMDLSVHQRVRL